MNIRLLFQLGLLLGLTACQSSGIDHAIRRELRDYPESRVQDIYKSFCQDNLGPGHLIPSPESARKYLEAELASFREDLDSLRYEAGDQPVHPVGDQENYVRVDLSTVLDGRVSEDALLDAFVRSANDGKKATAEEWARKWTAVAKVIRKEFPEIPEAEEDLRTLDSLIAAGSIIVHHSQVYNEVYHPHYRIVAADIFEKELKALIEEPGQHRD